MRWKTSSFGVRFGLCFLASSVATALLLGGAFYWQASQQSEQEARSHLRDLAALSVSAVDGDAHAALRKPEDEASDTFIRMKKRLQGLSDLCKDIRFAYTVRKDDQGRAVFVVTAENNSGKTVHLGEVHAKATPLLRETLDSPKGAVVEPLAVRGEQGDALSAYAPIRKADGASDGVLCIEVSAETVGGSTRAFLWMALGVSALVSILALGAGAALGKAFARPMILAAEHLGHVADGQVTRELPPELLARQDESSTLAKAIHQMTDGLRKTLTSLSNGVHTLAGSSSDLTAISGDMAGGARNTASKAGTVTVAAEEMSSNASLAARDVESAAQNLTTIATATEQMTATIADIASRAEKARQITAAATEQAKTVSVAIDQLGQAAREIGKVSETISSISAQTNLLALNATIEAARAGAAGKGFAVVANEVKELASQTAAATEDIKTKVQAIQASTSGAIDDMSAIANVIGEVSDNVMAIASAIDEQSAVTRDIATNIVQASGVVTDANRRVAQTSDLSKTIAHDIAAVNGAAGEMASSSEQVQARAAQLALLADQLNDAVGRFDLGEQGQAVAKKVFLEWSDALSVNVTSMDSQHKRFVELINELHDAMMSGKGAQHVGRVLDEVQRYTEYHFSAEEELMKKYQYSGLQQQQAAHAYFVHSLAEVRAKMTSGSLAASVEAMEMLTKWLVTHIKQMDKQYGTVLH